MFVSVCPKSCSAGVISADLDTPEGSGALSEDGGNCTAGREGAENKMAGARPFWRSQVFFLIWTGLVLYGYFFWLVLKSD